MPNQKTLAATEVQPTASNPLDFIPDEIPYDVPYGPLFHSTELKRLFTPPWPRQRSGIGR
jgi:hypothetical protein